MTEEKRFELYWLAITVGAILAIFTIAIIATR
jgi:hypothetical protein